MRKIKKEILSAFAIILFFIIALASNSSKQTFSNSKKWIPNDFNPKNTILLVQTFTVSSKAEKKMEAYMAEKYPYKYEFVDLQTIKTNQGKYSDTKLYRYALVISSHDTHSTKFDGGAVTSGGLTTTGFDYNFYDRETGKSYPATKKPSGYAIVTFKPVINTIVERFK